jgi:hypothetical protein
VSRHQEFANAHYSRLTSQVERRTGAYICQTPIYVRMAYDSMRSHRTLHLHTRDTPPCESTDKCLVAIALTDFISLENAHTKRLCCCSQNIPPTQAHPPRRQHNCPSILTIDSGTLRTPSASRSLVTNRAQLQYPLHLRASDILVSCSSVSLVPFSLSLVFTSSSHFGKTLMCTFSISFRVRTMTMRYMGGQVPLFSSQQDSWGKLSSVPR